MKKLICFLLFALTSLTGQAQKSLSNDYSYKVSEPYPVFDALNKYYFTKGNEALAVKFDGKDLLIQKFNTDTPSFIKEKRYDNPFQRSFQIESVLDMGGHFYLFFSSPELSTAKEQLFSIEINFENAEFIGQPKLMFQHEQNDGIQSSMDLSIANTNKYNFLQSQEKKDVLIQYRKKHLDKDGKNPFEVMELYSYDSRLNQLFKSEASMPYPETKINTLDYQVDHLGNLYLLAKIFDDNYKQKKNRKDTAPDYHLELLLVKAAESTVDITKFENKDKFINKLWLFDTNKGYLVGAGCYSNKQANFTDCSGLTEFKINPDGSIHDQVFHEISDAVVNQDEKPRTIRKNERREIKGKNSPFSDLELRDIYINDDGAIILMGEKYFVDNHTDDNNGKSHTTYRYHYTDMLVSKINADGSLGWMKKIKKNQLGARGKGAMSFKYFNANDSHYFVYFDNSKNIDLPLIKKPKKRRSGEKGGSLTAVKIDDNTGNLSRASIFNFNEVKNFKIYQFAVNRVFKTNQNAFMLEVFKENNEDVMIKVNLN